MITTNNNSNNYNSNCYNVNNEKSFVQKWCWSNKNTFKAEEFKKELLEKLHAAKDKKECIDNIIYQIAKSSCIANFRKYIFTDAAHNHELDRLEKITTILFEVIKEEKLTTENSRMQNEALLKYLNIQKGKLRFRQSDTDVLVFDLANSMNEKYDIDYYNSVTRIVNEDVYNKTSKKQLNKLGNIYIEDAKFDEKKFFGDLEERIKKSKAKNIKIVLNIHGSSERAFVVQGGKSSLPVRIIGNIFSLMNRCPELRDKNVEIINMSCEKSDMIFYVKYNDEDKKNVRQIDFQFNTLLKDFAKVHSGVVLYKSMIGPVLNTAGENVPKLYEYEQFKKNEKNEVVSTYLLDNEELIKRYKREKENFFKKMHDFLKIYNSIHGVDMDKYLNELYAVLISQYPLILDFKEKSKQKKNELVHTPAINNKINDSLDTNKGKGKKKNGCYIF